MGDYGVMGKYLVNGYGTLGILMVRIWGHRVMMQP